MKKLRRVIRDTLNCLSVSSNIWFILVLNLIDFLLCGECVLFSWVLGCQNILGCNLSKISVTSQGFLPGFKLQTILSSPPICSELGSLAGLLKVCPQALAWAVGRQSLRSPSSGTISVYVYIHLCAWHHYPFKYKEQEEGVALLDQTLTVF